jgi:hypothetical protein
VDGRLPESLRRPTSIEISLPQGPPTMWTAASAIDATLSYAQLYGFHPREERRTESIVATEQIDNEQATAS